MVPGVDSWSPYGCQLTKVSTMSLIEVMRSHRTSLTREDVRFMEGSARLLLSDGRQARVEGQLSMARTFFSLSGYGSFTCAADIAFYSVNSSCWLKLVFDDGPEADISIYRLRSGDSHARCWFEVKG
jgi:hypothetical protein